MIVNTKFNCEDTVWFLCENKAKESKIDEVRISIKQNILIEYFVFFEKWILINEKDCYSTREELINNL